MLRHNIADTKMLSVESTISSTRESVQHSSVDNNNLIEKSGRLSNNSQANETVSINESLSIRKRRACFSLKLKRLNFASFCEKTTTPESGDERAVNNEEIESLVSSSSSAYNSGNETSSAAENTDDSSGEEEQQIHLKRLRFDSVNSQNIFETINDVNEQQNEEQQQQVEEEKNSQKDNLLEEERYTTFDSDLILEDSITGKCYELIGSGRNCKAIDLSTQEMWHCQMLKQNEFNNLMEIVSRMKSVSNCYTEEGFAERSNLLLPFDQLQTLRSSKHPNIIYILLPNHYDSLSKLIEEECGEEAASFPYWCRPVCLSERLVQQILKQITVLLEFCHRIGLFFRDFRFCKFVFTDQAKTKLRLNNVLDLYISPSVDCDLINSREFIPAYISPEVLDKKNQVYGGRAADIWAFGVMMFTLLNGRLPFYEQSNNPIELFRRIRSHCFSSRMRSSVSEPARWLIHSLLKPRPDERPSAAQILQAHWFRNTSTMGLSSIWSSCSSYACKQIEKLQQTNNCKTHLLNPVRSFFQEQNESDVGRSEVIHPLRYQAGLNSNGSALVNMPSVRGSAPSFVSIHRRELPFISLKIEREKVTEDQVVPDLSG
uniref:Protein kinase domain-containing protein n=1 Tax=Meloidogyne floridensis TaxID=298350 RepID=A0A915P3V1_9BILA